jgi:hypothetical protein
MSVMPLDLLLISLWFMTLVSSSRTSVPTFLISRRIVSIETSIELLCLGKI